MKDRCAYYKHAIGNLRIPQGLCRPSSLLGLDCQSKIEVMHRLYSRIGGGLQFVFKTITDKAHNSNQIEEGSEITR